MVYDIITYRGRRVVNKRLFGRFLSLTGPPAIRSGLFPSAYPLSYFYASFSMRRRKIARRLFMLKQHTVFPAPGQSASSGSLGASETQPDLLLPGCSPDCWRMPLRLTKAGKFSALFHRGTGGTL